MEGRRFEYPDEDDALPGVAAVNRLVTEHLDDVFAACRRHHVQRLTLFGSATGDRFRPGESDIDFIVDYQPLELGQRARAFFGLIKDLEEIFGAEIDLIDRRGMRNPYFIQAVRRDRVEVFEAA